VGGRGEEGDDQYRNRIMAHIRGVSSQSNSAKLEALALDNGYYYAKILERENCNSIISPPFGAVYLIVCSTTIPSGTEYEVIYPVDVPNNIYEELRNDIEYVRPLGVGVVVREADIININFDAPGIGVTIDSQYDPTLVQADIEAKLYDYFLTSKGIGEKVYKTEIIEIILEVDGVVDVDINFIMTFEKITGITTSATSYEPLGNEVILFESPSSAFTYIV
jgi:phage-related baseplate assembly protein